MNSIGVFRKKKIDGKSFFIYTSSSSVAESDLGGDDLPLQPLFLCPSIRLRVETLKQKESDLDSFIPFNTSPNFPDQQVHHLLDSENQYSICELPIVPLFWCNNKKSDFNQFYCGACASKNLGTSYYFCATCYKSFHKECVESPLQIKHPSYPFDSLILSNHPNDNLNCTSCEFRLTNMAYYCPMYKLSMDPVCAMKPIPLVIDHPKRHSHPLSFFPRQAFLPCNVCGLIKEPIPTYACVRCDFVVHQDCIYFPNVIRISRHHHRISFTSSLPSGKLSCGVCRQRVDNNYSAYSCSNCSDYFVHTRCACRRDVWDGEDLEGVPEEPEIVVEPFETMADGIILHFSHSHHLKLDIIRVYDENKICQACILPIYEGNYYSCMDQCEFILHEICAYAPRKIYHALYPHPLTLKVVFTEINEGGMFQCDACMNLHRGFIYHSSVGDRGFKLDLRCALVSEPFRYHGHEHPLFLALKPNEDRSAICQICQGKPRRRKLNCIECEYIICFKCATLPYKARYKHDKHFLTFRKEKETSDHSDWCEVCESKLVYSRKGGFYACNICCTTLHVDCLLGEDTYLLRPGQTTVVLDNMIQLLPNNTLCRPFCHKHELRCSNKVIFKWGNMIFCSYRCCYFYTL